MRRFVEDDAAAFDALFNRYAGRVHAYLFSLVGAPAADDLTQATFLSVLRARGRFDPRGRFRPWIYAIATNAARDQLRRQRSEELRAPDEVPDQAYDPGPSRDEPLERAVQAAVAALPATQREAVVLHRFQSLSFAEIAQSLGLTETAVKVRAHRGYERLRVLLAGLRPDAT